MKQPQCSRSSRRRQPSSISHIRVAGGSFLSLTFRKKGKDLDAFIKITKGQMQCGYRDCGFVLRVGDGKAQK
ncbi:hypothetical protein [Pseudomonas aeruginosa]|uniref:hypothetical protein n=1 Tax=Pseudomonas aeruginosa TaxID=287 RepID=UPI001E5D248A|nr:hypothetical protein [Pseudomonas aeruginosa]